MLPTEKWLNNPAKILQSESVDEDRYTQCATWLLGRVNNMIHQPANTGATPDDEAYLVLKQDLARWESLAAPSTKPLMQRDSDHLNDQPFPYVLFANESSTLAHILWHTAMILFLQFGSSLPGIQTDSSPSTEAIHNHARLACGIIETNSASSSILINAVQPLWICGRQLRAKCEKFSVLVLLAQIERDTGWKTRWRADGLRQLWELG